MRYGQRRKPLSWWLWCCMIIRRQPESYRRLYCVPSETWYAHKIMRREDDTSMMRLSPCPSMMSGDNYIWVMLRYYRQARDVSFVPLLLKRHHLALPSHCHRCMIIELYYDDENMRHTSSAKVPTRKYFKSASVLMTSNGKWRKSWYFVIESIKWWSLSSISAIRSHRQILAASSVPMQVSTKHIIIDSASIYRNEYWKQKCAFHAWLTSANENRDGLRISPLIGAAYWEVI